MVSKKKLIERIELLEKRNGEMIKAIQVLNRRVNKHVKSEDSKEEEKNKITEWLNDERLDGIQDYLHKGVK